MMVASRVARDWVSWTESPALAESNFGRSAAIQAAVISVGALGDRFGPSPIQATLWPGAPTTMLVSRGSLTHLRISALVGTGLMDLEDRGVVALIESIRRAQVAQNQK